MIYAFFLFVFVQKSFLTKIILLFAEINLTSRGPLYTCLVLVWLLKYNAKCYRLDTIRDGLTIVAHFLVHDFKKWMISKCHKVDIIEIDVLNNLWQIWNMSKFFCNMDQGNIEFVCILIYYARAKFPLIIWNTVWRFPWMNIILQIWAFCCKNREIDLERKEICPHEY